MATAAIIAAPAAPASLAATDPDIAFERRAEDGAKRAAARRAAGDPHIARQCAHRGVAIARGEGEPFHHGAHQIPVAVARAQTEELRAGLMRDERPALAGIGDEGMKQQLAGLGLQHLLIQPPDQVGARARHAFRGKQSRARSSSQSMFSVAAMLDCIWA